MRWSGRCACALVVLLAASCDGGYALPWTVTGVEDPTVRVDVRIHEGSCDMRGSELWSASVDAGDGEGMEPPELDDGRYAFVAVGIDESCRIVAEGCSDVAVGERAERTVQTRLRRVIGGARLCPAEECNSGRCTGGDASVLDATTPDANVSDGSLDAPTDAGMPDTGVDACVPGCFGDELRDCVSPPVTCPAGCNATTSSCFTIRAANLGELLVPTGAADIHFTSSVNVDTSDCSLPGVDADIDLMMGGGAACVFRGQDVIVDAGVVVNVFGSWPLIILATGSVSIFGEIDVSATADESGPGGHHGGRNNGDAGEGPSPGEGGETGGPRDDSGAGGGGHCGAGGDGGDTNDAPMPGFGGSAVVTDLEPLVGGSGGGAGSSDGGLEARGGAGGGALQISAAGPIVITGALLAGGGGGEGGPGNSESSGGGGGAGGGVLLEAPTVTLTPTGRIVATGGGGGGGASGDLDMGMDGMDGRSFLGTAPGGAGGPETPTGGDGGDGGGGASLDGAQGGMSLRNGGGGGGGAGCIVLRNRSASVPVGMMSPSITPGIRAFALRIE